MLSCSWLVRSATKNRRGEEGEQNPNQRTRDVKPEGNTPAGLFSGWICLHVIFSSFRRTTFHVARNFFRPPLSGLLPEILERFQIVDDVCHGSPQAFAPTNSRQI